MIILYRLFGKNLSILLAFLLDAKSTKINIYKIATLKRDQTISRHFPFHFFFTIHFQLVSRESRNVSYILSHSLYSSRDLTKENISRFRRCFRRWPARVQSPRSGFFEAARTKPEEIGGSTVHNFVLRERKGGIFGGESKSYYAFTRATIFFSPYL